MVFGEGIVNDAVAIILYNTMTGFVTDDQEFTAATPLIIIGDFLVLALASIGIGIFYGLLCSYIFKVFRFVTVSAVKESLLIFSVGYMAYASAEIFHFSGIIA